MDLGFALPLIAVLAPLWAVLIAATVVTERRAAQTGGAAKRLLLSSQAIAAAALAVVVAVAGGSVPLRAVAGAGLLLVVAGAAVGLLMDGGRKRDASTELRSVGPKDLVWLLVAVAAADAIMLAGLRRLEGPASVASVVLGVLVLSAAVVLLRRSMRRRGRA